MKNIFLSILALLASTQLFGTIRTVDNRIDLPTNPGQFTTIQAAITASSPGDTIMVAGSPIAYGSPFNVNKQLVFLGPGYNPLRAIPLVANITSGFTFNSSNTSGSKVMGFVISGGITLTGGGFHANIQIRRNSISGLYAYDSTSNLLFAENIVSGAIQFNGGGVHGHTNCNIVNNIFTGGGPIVNSYGYGIVPLSNPSITFAHNLWINGNVSNPLISSNWNNFGNPCLLTTGMRNMNIRDNIFYNTNGGTVGYNPADQNCLLTPVNYNYNNNLTFAGGPLPLLPTPGTIGGGNLNNVNPLFTSILNSGNPVDFNLDNFRLLANSPAKFAATDSTDIGPTGGAYPIYLSTNPVLTGEPPIPAMRFLNHTGTNSVIPGGNLQIQVKAKKIN